MRENDAPFTLHVEGREGEVLLVPTGDLDPSTAPSVAAVLRQHRGDAVVIDLTDVDFADSSIVRVLVEERDHASLEGGRLTLSGASERVRRSFEVSGVADRFDWAD
jgi:anti-sigma B factor antagonist